MAESSGDEDEEEFKDDWVTAFCETEGNDMYCEVDRDISRTILIFMESKLLSLIITKKPSTIF